MLKAEKINILAFKALQMGIMQSMLNEGQDPSSIMGYLFELGRGLGDLLYLNHPAMWAPTKVSGLREALASIYAFLFGETMDKIGYEHDEGSGIVRLIVVARRGLPTCRNIVAPHPSIKLGAFIAGAFERLVELRMDELGIKRVRCWEDKCVAAGDGRCELIVELDLVGGEGTYEQ